MWCSSNFMTGGLTNYVAWPWILRTKSYGVSIIQIKPLCRTFTWYCFFSIGFFLEFDLSTFESKIYILHESKVLMIYRSDVPDICGHSVQSSRLKLFAVRRSEVYFSRFAFLTIKNHVQFSPRVVYLPKTERDCWTSTKKDSTLEKFPSNNAFGQLKIWEPLRYRQFQVRLHRSKKVLLKVYLLLFTVTFCLTSQSQLLLPF